MSNRLKCFLVFLFFFSGCVSLVYQTVWIRLAYAHFGAILPVMSVSISVFMLGLGLGSFFGGKFIETLSNKTKISPAIFYGCSEILIGLGAILMPILFSFGQKILLGTGQTNSIFYMASSALCLSISMLPWCIAMGTTFPFIMSFVKKVSNDKSSFSFLYTANVLGSVFGVLCTVIFMIEIFGLLNTLHIAATINLIIACTAFYMSKNFALTNNKNVQILNENFQQISSGEGVSTSLLKIILFTTGFVSLGLEVAWTRAFSPALGTLVYAFSFLLAGYLAATYIGTLIYRHHIKQNKVFSIAFLLATLALTSFLPIIINDPHLLDQGFVVNITASNFYKYLAQITLTIFPVCMVLGYLTPQIIDSYSAGNEKKAGETYAINVLGCIFGPLVVSYILLPLMSAKAVMIIFSGLYVILFLIVKNNLSKKIKISFCLIFAALFLISSLYTNTYEFPFSNRKVNPYPGQLLITRDSVATVHALVEKRPTGYAAELFVNGFGMTGYNGVTKIMGHLPLAIHPNPKSVLIICFGIGTTFRSVMSWGVKTTAVELVPGVVKSFPIFFGNANKLLNNPNGKIIIDDGRRFLMRTDEKFDVITLDPPPPLESAGSSLLYSREFYQLVKLRLAQGGILQQWIPISVKDFSNYTVMRAIIKSISDEFAYIQIYYALQDMGIHISASMTPIPSHSPQTMVAKMPASAIEDMLEWLEVRPEQIYAAILNRGVSKEALLRGWNEKEYITDSHPYNEYFLLRK
jgi:spermidine synthase